jgi:alpha-glucosidase
MLVQVIRKDKGPFWTTINGRKIEHFIQRDKWEASEEGWYYSATLGTAMVKYKNIDKSYELVVSFEKFDLIGM